MRLLPSKARHFHFLKYVSDERTTSAFSFLAARFDTLRVPVSSERTLVHSKSPTNEIRRSRNLKLNIRSPLLHTFKKNVQHSRRQRATPRKNDSPRCTSKTLSKPADKAPSVCFVSFHLCMQTCSSRQRFLPADYLLCFTSCRSRY